MCDINKLRKIKSQVEFCLQQFPETRNSDKRLFIKLCQTFYQIELNINLDQLFELPNPETVRRMRQKFQEKKLYPPTEEKIALERGWRKNDWLKALGYYVENPEQNKFDFIT